MSTSTPGISWIQLPNGICFPLENQKFIEVQGNNLVLSDYNGGSRAIPFDTATIAASVLTSVQAVMAMPVTFTNLINSLTFAAIGTPNPNPATATVNAPTTYTITGTGFLSALGGSSLVKFDDGASHVEQQALTVNTDTNAQAELVTLTAAATYTIYYSTDGGSTWTVCNDGTNNLVITAS
jgi:hypothetical protein